MNRTFCLGAKINIKYFTYKIITHVSNFFMSRGYGYMTWVFFFHKDEVRTCVLRDFVFA